MTDKKIKSDKNYPTFKKAFILILLVINAQIFFSLYFELIDNSNTIINAALVNIISIGLVLLIGHEKTKQKFEVIFPLRKIPLIHYILIPITCIGLVIIFSELDNIIQYFLPIPDLFKNILKKIFDANHFIASFFLLVIVAPFTEEFLFRGLLLHGFLKNYSSVKAIILSSFLFGLIHLNPWQFFGAFLVGIYLAWYYIKTRSLIPCILIHAIMNGIPVLLINILRYQIPGFTMGITEKVSFQPLYLDIIGIFITITGISISYLFFKKDTPKTE